jgi:hypothetical protein
MSNPTHLYKYQRLTAYSLASLLNDTVWLSNPTAFNDPFDCAITLSKDKLRESLDHAITEIAKRNDISKDQIANHDKVTNQDEQAYEWLRSSLKNTMQKIGVLCLSATPNEILMWSHYAENHKGFCVEYDFSETSHLRKITQAVRYSETIPALSLANLIKDAETNFLDICIFTKAKQWGYEQEWRAIMNEGGRSFQSPSKTTSIIFGARMPPEEKSMLYHALKHKKDIEFKEAQLLEDRFAIQFSPFKI